MMGPKRILRGTRGAEEALRTTREDSEDDQKGPKTAQYGPTIAQEDPYMPPKRPNGIQGQPQDGPGRSHDRPPPPKEDNGVGDRPKGANEGGERAGGGGIGEVENDGEENPATRRSNVSHVAPL